MRLLLDTHIFLWVISGDTRLSNSLRESIRAPHNEVYLSVVSLWETIIKYQLWRLPLPEPPESYVPKQRDRHRIASLALDEASVAQLATLPALHGWPHDLGDEEILARLLALNLQPAASLGSMIALATDPQDQG